MIIYADSVTINWNVGVERNKKGVIYDKNKEKGKI